MSSLMPLADDERAALERVAVFTQGERPIVEPFAAIRPFLELSVGHVIGLLGALGEYAIRAGRDAMAWKDAMPGVWDHPEAVVRHDALCRFWWTRYRSWGRLQAEDDSALDPAIPLPDPRRPIFAEALREELALFKYIRGLEVITASELCALLARLAAYAAVAEPMPFPGGGWIEGPWRLVHGHNRVLAFPGQPFTLS